MNTALRQPRLTREEFFDWAEAQDTRFEFDGGQPVAMTGGSNNHSVVCQNLYLALGTRLRRPCRVMGPDAGLATIGDTVRYPDALITCAKLEGDARVVPGVVVVFEALSPGSDHIDKIVKLREYHAVPSISRYVVLERTSATLTVFARDRSDDPWIVNSLLEAEILALPEIGIEVPVAEFFADVELPAMPAEP